MNSTKQTTSDPERQTTLQYAVECLDLTFSPETQNYFEAALKKQQARTDANQAEVDRQKEQERRHRDHVRRVKELERDNRKRNPDR